MDINQKSILYHIINWHNQHILLTAALVCLLTGAAVSCLPFSGQVVLGWWLVGGIFVLGVVWLLLLLKKNISDSTSGVLWWGMGSLLRLSFMLRIQYYEFQHDVNFFTSPDGHAGYISYFLTERQLPGFDVREVWQFYHPPLHHILTAVWMQLMGLLGMDTERVCESSQVLPFTYSCLSLAVFGLLLRHFHVKGFAFSLMMGVMALHPAFIILSGSINNDMLSIFLMMTALLLTCQWYREQKFSTMIKLALAIGCGMMAKLSAWMAAPAAAVIFLLILLQNRKQPLPCLGQYAAFGCVCVPLGLWWGVRNLVLHGVPMTYIPLLGEDSRQYVGNIPVLQRLFDFSPKQFSYIYDNFTMYGQAYDEYNPLLGLLKTAVFEEFVNTDRYPAVIGTGEVLFWAQVLLAGLALGAMVWVCRKYSVPDDAEKLALTLTYFVTLMSYISFCLTYPHTCTQSIRYATPVIYVSLLFLGIFLTKSKPVFRKITAAVASVFMAASFLIYGILLYI